MNVINLVSIILCSKNKKMICLVANNDYLWKILHIRNNKINKFLGSYFDSFILCHSLENIRQDAKIDYGELILFDYDITNLSDSILVNNLIYLDLSYNKLINIPSEIGLLNNLNFLSLDCNQLIILPSEIGLLVKLKTLNLSDNFLSNISSELGLLTNLDYFDIVGNPLKILPAELNWLTHFILIADIYTFFINPL